MIAAQGIRVARGEAWNYADHDGGEGGLGTIVHVHNDIGKAIVTVIWDNGTKCWYQVGREESRREIVVQDLQQNGECYGKSCHGCGMGILGSLWNCVICANLYLCSKCYMDDVHDVKHAFRRKIKSDGDWMVMPARRGSKKVTAKGHFPGATVERNTTLRNQVLRNAFQSLDENVGRIINYESNTYTAISVVWSQHFRQAVYQLGKDGKVDVRCTVYGFGPSYYVGHLPGLMQSQILRSKPRGYTISQLPLHRGLQYMSLRTNHCDAYPIGTLPDLTGNQKLNAGAVSASGHHRYAKSSTMDTKLLNSLDDSSNMTKLGYGVKQARTADTTANRKTAFEGLNSKSHEQVVGVRNDRKDFETAAIAENGYSLIQSNESSSHSGSKPGAGNGTEWHAGKMTDVTSCNSGMVTKLNVGDEVKIKDEKDILIELPTWILDHCIGRVGRLQFVDDEEFCFIQFAGHSELLKLPSDVIVKVKNHGSKDQALNKIQIKMEHSQHRTSQTAINPKAKQDSVICVNSNFIQRNKQTEVQQFESKSSTNNLKVKDSRSISGGSNDSDLQKSDGRNLCCLCQQNECDMMFKPCGHQITCANCSSYFKKCFQCNKTIEKEGRTDNVSYCIICCENVPDVRFIPCNHKIICKDCSMEIESCIKCRTKIIGKINNDGNMLEMLEPRLDPLKHLIGTMERLKYKVMGIESTSTCRLCLRNNRNFFFQCGHSTCEPCGENLIICPTCHEKIEVKTLHD